MVWEGGKHLFFSFLSFSFVGLGTQLFVEKIWNYVEELQNRKLFGFKCYFRFSKKFQNQKNNKDTFLEERLWPRSHLQNRLSGYLGNRTFAGCPVLATLGRIQWSGLACALKQKPGSLPIARAISMSFI